jgi:hypothetical protein
MGYVPAGDALVAVVDAVAAVVRLATLSPFTKPLYVTVSAGNAEPYVEL